MAKSKSSKAPIQKATVSVDDPIDDLSFSNGPSRPFLNTTPSLDVVKARKLLPKEYLLLASLVVFAVNIRLADLAFPNSVVFDEVHFGGFSKKYILGTYFMDVHPPLAKMLFAAVALVGGFKGDFSFEKIGNEYPEGVPFQLMRIFPALLGIGTVLLCYLTLRAGGCRPTVCFITSGLLIIENANVTISRYILLDSPLIFFIAAAVYSYKRFENSVPFTFTWYKSLIACGIALGLSLSSKWVGLFTISWVGVCCLLQLWFIIGDLSVRPKTILSHFAIRGAVLLGIPLALYITFFYIHFNLLPNEGDGAAFMSSAFRTTLNGNTIPRDIEAHVGLGSIVTIRHVETQAGYLHSHNHFYPAGSKQQQITLYPHLDSNNKWVIEHYNRTTTEEFEPLHDGMKIRLKHLNTGKRLHSHDEKPPVSERDWQKEVSCYGYEGFAGDANDDWIVEVIQKSTKDIPSKYYVKALTTVFRLKHAMSGNYLFAASAKLPSWGFEQQEVTAAGSGSRPLTFFHIETNENYRVPSNHSLIVNYAEPSFLEKFVEVHKRMWKINAGLTDHHPWQSSPHEWPLLLRGINYWVKDSKHVYFFGNPAIWWASSLSLLTFAVYVTVQIVRWQAAKVVVDEKHVFNFNYQVLTYFLGWFLHYFPFFIMGRQLFLHHYLPALYFGILTTAHFLDIALSYFATHSTGVKYVVFGIFGAYMAISTYFYINYSPLIYGQKWTKSRCEAAKLVGTWDFDCNSYPNNLSEYNFNTQTKTSKADALPNDNIEPNEPKETPLEVVKRAISEESSSQKAPEANSEKNNEEEPLAPPEADPETN
ncbi:Dolichyl-phosphate-mannose--protein mannosyltransferase 1 [Yamadazyma tenuis]|uniref:Dolichyl-phosphate-mannose--protein mannosyltransferase n=1 Tax=Candida tenuis (strain ATCC 10573 / BCRC 21748 / CBS 615 / JCM 9827 / NBRC 10315 / NRRL Y-1498 / VKM Y-70) TaxID=590646 RepID=G3B9M7_CANTC|nr:uncharacterized protein CANTEDRAFT_125279 [Yamadazyma tenuis ATCC 10573]EGV61928.1 hypothetical protein CANTEDRAFT_125279 [Yamadazyma tenuis ATCC 10573]WEJ93163.1 Dolichyl-phosphate-mannose--protein mannosyltransferase 1 [Yamadazyma tenuis]